MLFVLSSTRSTCYAHTIAPRLQVHKYWSSTMRYIDRLWKPSICERMCRKKDDDLPAAFLLGEGRYLLKTRVTLVIEQIVDRKARQFSMMAHHKVGGLQACASSRSATAMSVHACTAASFKADTILMNDCRRMRGEFSHQRGAPMIGRCC